MTRLVERDSALIGVMTQRCVDRGCEGGDENEAQADSSESCLEFYGDGVDLVRWCDPCLMSAAINAMQALTEEGKSDPARFTDLESGTETGSATRDSS